MTPTNFYGQSSAISLNHTTGNSIFSIVAPSSLRFQPNAGAGIFELYLWAYQTDPSDATKIINKRASKLYIELVEPVIIKCGLTITKLQDYFVFHNMTLNSTD